ncbi:MAG: hypothetical protein LBN26_09500 [Christensenellaceae bacterium]|nr:hypothetical protein [Christensenellaceae bacterium]
MAQDKDALRALLRQSITPVYDRAMQNTGDAEAAKDITRRAMELFKRAVESGMEPSKALALRIADDCCNEMAFFNRKLEAAAGHESAPEVKQAERSAPAQEADLSLAAEDAPAKDGGRGMALWLIIVLMLVVFVILLAVIKEPNGGSWLMLLWGKLRALIKI